MKQAVVHIAVAPLYLKPAHRTELDDEVLYGMRCALLEKCENGFWRVCTPNRYESLCHESSLCFDESELERYDQAPRMTVLAPTADVLAEPNFRAGLLLMLTRGALVETAGTTEDGKWTRLRLVGGQTGYVRTSHLGPHHTTQNGDEAAFRENVANTALSFLHTQYRWGGRTPLGIDCSGLAAQAYLMNGVVIYRNADIREGFPVHEIPRGCMKRGDLLFFPGHVALYLGNSRYIHATGLAGSDGVVINSLDPADPDYRADLDKGITQVGSIF